jgi:flagellar protein FlaG
MAIKPIDSSTGIDLVRDAAPNSANSRHSQRPAVRTPESATAATSAQQPTLNAAVQNKPPPPPAAQSPSMRIHVDQDTGKTVVALVNPESGEVLRQMPSAEALEVAKAIGRYQGMFVNLKV